MMKKLEIYFSEWTDKELKEKVRCFCTCHTEPGVYPTTEDKPCTHCGHVNLHGYLPASLREGWVEYWRSDKAGF